MAATDRINPNLLKNVKNLSPEQQREILSLLDELEDAEKKEAARQSFLGFISMAWPSFIEGRHHKIMADAFERVANGELKRLIINMPPRHTKSEFASFLLPAWFLGRFPEKKIIQTAHTAELSVGFGRKVRNLVDSEDFKAVFPSVSLRSDSKAAGRWSTNKGGEYFAIGVGGAVTGKGADLLIIDDPHSEQEGQSADPGVFDKVYEWYTSGPRQRLQPGGAIIVVMCMTGDTRVLMADGSESLLKDIRPGDMVATYEDGRLTTARLNNWRSSGCDSVYKIKTESGRMLRANERHPFLVECNGERRWVRLKNLKPGMGLVSLKDALVLPGQKQSLGFAAPAKLKQAITARIQMLLTAMSGTTANGKASSVLLKAAKNLQYPKGIAALATRKLFRLGSGLLGKTGRLASNIATASPLSNMTEWLRSATIDAMCAAKSLAQAIPAPIGTASFASITAMTQARCGAFSATIATLQSGTEKARKRFAERQPISTFTVDRIVEITPDGEEEVFDVEVDRTENFIANGVVSHNTRWHKRDLTGQILKSSLQRQGSDEWEVIEFPAIMPSGEPLWPQFWPKPELEALRNELPASKWNAQYQQNPTSEEGAIVKREWWREWEKDVPPPCEFIIQSWDTAFLKTQRADYSACTTWGVFYHPDDDGRMQPNIILLDAYKERLEFPELKKAAFEYWSDWQPDAFIVEAKAAGTPLIFELRAMGIPVSEYTPSRGNDKIARVNAVADLFASGTVWAPATRFAEEVIEEFASFPAGEHDDLVDSSTQALLRFRQGGFLRLHTDEEDEPLVHQRAEYY